MQKTEAQNTKAKCIICDTLGAESEPSVSYLIHLFLDLHYDKLLKHSLNLLLLQYNIALDSGKITV